MALCPVPGKGGGAFNTNGTNKWEEAQSGSVLNSNVSAYKGNYMAALWDGGATSCVTDLVTPLVNLKTYSNAKVKFYYIACNYFGFDDSLAVFYYIGKHGSLHSLPIPGYKTVNSNANPKYDSATLTIPGGSDSVYVDFRGYYNQDNGIFIDNVTVTGNHVAGMEDLQTSGGNITVYPNPTRGIVQIASENNVLKTIDIYTIIGEKVQTENVSGHFIQLNLSNQPNGIYFYKALGEGGATINEGKIVLNK